MLAGFATRPVAAQTLRPWSAGNVSLAQFDRLKMGMRYREAVALLGCAGTERSSDEEAGDGSVMYGRDGADLGANMEAEFDNGHLDWKSQFGLR